MNKESGNKAKKALIMMCIPLIAIIYDTAQCIAFKYKLYLYSFSVLGV